MDYLNNSWHHNMVENTLRDEDRGIPGRTALLLNICSRIHVRCDAQTRNISGEADTPSHAKRSTFNLPGRRINSPRWI